MFVMKKDGIMQLTQVKGVSRVYFRQKREYSEITVEVCAMRISFSDTIGILGIVLAIVLVVLDKAGKLKGGWLVALLCLAGAMTLFIAVGNSWVMDAPEKWKIWRGAFMIALVALAYSGVALWILGNPNEGASVAEDENAELRFKHTALFYNEKAGSVFVQGRTVKLHAVYENTSGATAKEISANGVLRFITGGQGMKDREEEEWNKFRTSWLASLQGTLKEELEGHKEKSFDIETDPLSPEDAQNLKSAIKYVYLMAAIKWADKTGEYETDICTYFSPNEHGEVNAPAIWRSCLSGHSMIRRPFKFTDIRPTFTQRANVQILQMGFPADPPASDPKWIPGERILLRIQAINNGPIPANKMAGSFRIAISSGSSEQADQERIWAAVKTQLDAMPYGDNSLMPGKDALIDIQYPLALYHEVALTAKDIQQIKAGTKRIVVAGIYKYIDDYGPRETHICQSYSGTSWRYWIDCFAHNELIP